MRSGKRLEELAALKLVQIPNNIKYCVDELHPGVLHTVLGAALQLEQTNAIIDFLSIFDFVLFILRTKRDFLHWALSMLDKSATRYVKSLWATVLNTNLTTNFGKNAERLVLQGFGLVSFLIERRDLESASKLIFSMGPYLSLRREVLSPRVSFTLEVLRGIILRMGNGKGRFFRTLLQNASEDTKQTDWFIILKNEVAKHLLACGVSPHPEDSAFLYKARQEPAVLNNPVLYTDISVTLLRNTIGRDLKEEQENLLAYIRSQAELIPKDQPSLLLFKLHDVEGTILFNEEDFGGAFLKYIQAHYIAEALFGTCSQMTHVSKGRYLVARFHLVQEEQQSAIGIFLEINEFLNDLEEQGSSILLARGNMEKLLAKVFEYLSQQPEYFEFLERFLRSNTDVNVPLFPQEDDLKMCFGVFTLQCYENVIVELRSKFGGDNMAVASQLLEAAYFCNGSTLHTLRDTERYLYNSLLVLNTLGDSKELVKGLKLQGVVLARQQLFDESYYTLKRSLSMAQKVGLPTISQREIIEAMQSVAETLGCAEKIAQCGNLAAQLPAQ